MNTNYKTRRARSGIRFAQRQRPKMRRFGQQKTIISSALIVTLALGFILLFNISLNRETQATTNVDHRSAPSDKAGMMATYQVNYWESSGYAAEPRNSFKAECKEEECIENKKVEEECIGIDYSDDVKQCNRINLIELRLKIRYQSENN